MTDMIKDTARKYWKKYRSLSYVPILKCQYYNMNLKMNGLYAWNGQWRKILGGGTSRPHLCTPTFKFRITAWILQRMSFRSEMVSETAGKYWGKISRSQSCLTTFKFKLLQYEWMDEFGAEVISKTVVKYLAQIHVYQYQDKSIPVWILDRISFMKLSMWLKGNIGGKYPAQSHVWQHTILSITTWVNYLWLKRSGEL